MLAAASQDTHPNRKNLTPAEKCGEELRAVIAGLLEWSSDMGGWEARVWSDTETLMDTLRDEETLAKRGGPFGKPDPGLTPAEKRGEELREFVSDLIDWESNSGGWDCRAWSEARQVLANLRRKERARKMGGPYGRAN